MGKYKYKSNAICPWCDHEHDDTFEFFNSYDGDGSVSEVTCHSCEKDFEITIHISVEYSTSIECPGHELDLSEYESIFCSKDEIVNKKELCLTCKVCHEDFYTWQLPNGKYPKMKDGQFKFIGKAVEIMSLRK